MEESKIRRIRRTRAKIFGTAERPRLAVFRSNSQISAQLIDDNAGKTLVSASSLEIKEKSNPVKLAQLTGMNLAKKANAKKIKTAVFDRRGYQYHGRVKALAEGAREGGLQI
jgi:large subunit ribosomal protein L18